MKVLRNKKELREHFLNKRDEMGEEEVRLFSERINERIRSLPEFKKAKKLLLFCPFKKEPDITPIFLESTYSGKETIFPKVDKNELRLYKVDSMEAFKRGSFCILEPQYGEEINPEEVELAFVPGLAFNIKGYRIGFGKGFYDRLLKKIRGVKVGVAYSFQMVEEFPTDEWDQPVDFIVTEEYVIEKGGKRYEL
ncbi:MAG: 5-formyltetrahydrofolate cyclo-ligase [Aquificaceae bacterium]